MTPQQLQIKALQDQLVASGYMTPEEAATGPGIFGPRTTAAYKKAVADAVANHEKLATLTKTNPASKIVEAYTGGDFSGLTTATGAPFSPADQQEAMSKASEQLKPYYDQLKQKETADAVAKAAQKQLDIKKQLAEADVNFSTDKEKLDQDAVDKGVLFSGSRLQKQKALEEKYKRESDYLTGSVEGDLANTARDFQYKYGSNAMDKLSPYLKVSGRSYDAGVAGGSALDTGAKKAYDPGSVSFSGTRNAEQASNINLRAADLLKNKGNKLFASGYQNQF